MRRTASRVWPVRDSRRAVPICDAATMGRPGIFTVEIWSVCRGWDEEAWYFLFPCSIVVMVYTDGCSRIFPWGVCLHHELQCYGGWDWDCDWDTERDREYRDRKSRDRINRGINRGRARNKHRDRKHKDPARPVLVPHQRAENAHPPFHPRCLPDHSMPLGDAK